MRHVSAGQNEHINMITKHLAIEVRSSPQTYIVNMPSQNRTASGLQREEMTKHIVLFMVCPSSHLDVKRYRGQEYEERAA